MAQSYTWNSALSAEAEALQQHAEQQDRIWGYTNGGGPHTLTVNKLVDVLSCNLNMIYTTQIVRLDGLILVASTDDQNVPQLGEFKQQIRQVIKRLSPSAEPRASIESDNYLMHYLLNDNITFVCITERAYPKKLAMTYLEDVRTEFQSTHDRSSYLDPTLRPYAYAEFERFLERTKKTYQDSRATDNMGRLNDELRGVTQVMTKNINDLLYRGDSLEQMGEMSSRLREDSAKYKRAAVRINWELLLKQYGPVAGIVTLMVLFIGWRFFG